MDTALTLSDDLITLTNRLKAYRHSSVQRFVIVFVLSLCQIMIGGLLLQAVVIRAMLNTPSQN